MEYSEALDKATWEVDQCTNDYIEYWMRSGLKGDLQDFYASAVRYSIQEVAVRRGIDTKDLLKIYETTLSAGANTPISPPPTITPPSGGGFFNETDK